MPAYRKRNYGLNGKAYIISSALQRSAISIDI